MQTSDPFNLSRFVAAQEHTYQDALQEIRNGRKTSHWIWFVFPQVKGLGYSSLSQFYGITSLDEARAYLAHQQLGARLREIIHALLAHKDESAEQILGYIDAVKVRSSMTLFDLIEPDSVFAQVLECFYHSARDAKTLKILKLS